MEQDGSGNKPPDDDYFGIKADGPPPSPPAGHSHPHLGSQNSGTINSATANSATANANTDADAHADTPSTPPCNGSPMSKEPLDKRRGHNDSDSVRRRGKGHDGRKESNKDGHTHNRENHKDYNHNIERHNNEHTHRESKNTSFMNNILSDLEDIECYHGNILEDEIKTVLNKNGDYIIRMAVAPDGSKGVVITIIVGEEKVDFPVKAKNFETEGGKEFLFTLDNKTRAPSIKDLVRKHTMLSIPVLRGKSEVWLLNPIAKQSWELRPENVELIKKLGEGAFGEVYSGKLRLPLKKFCNVAVKVIKRTANTDKATLELQKEAAIMRKLKHVNIVRFYGLAMKKDSIMVVMDLINGGGLDSYVKKHPDTPPEERAGYAGDIANGLAYLHAQGVMHRDVACRNCLLDLYRHIAKVSDFGLARQAEEHKLRPDERIPIRWTAPEVVKTFVYTKAADIYAYGILVFEIFSNASLPFEGYNNAQIKENIHRDDFRPKFPDTTPPEIIEVISKCWLTDPAARTPLFDVAKKIAAIIKKKSDDDEAGTQPQNGKMKKSAEGGRVGGGSAVAVSKEKISKVARKTKASSKSKERAQGKGGKSKEFFKSFKNSRPKKEGRDYGGSREGCGT